ncbi:hypothetical protein [Blastococcus tunisiensis]|uniref:Uncharacterized protein n=1 Tax=Blastococcus tunisiensis TaxID=1798228 RepID=A0A1I2J0B5_9ACTN|nr:hypothetical protein [Blastococcus sp. DSM 46838]SFF47448.1 hypothetical protein SAMN05216574_114130 [Blastococcus sp. DSM 46838]
MKRAVVGLIAAVVAVVGVVLLRSELMTVDVAQPEGSYTDVVVAAATVREDPSVREEMTRGLVSACRLLVNADVVEDSFLQTGDGVFAFRLRPGLDEFDRRELRGCLRDLRVQHLLLDVRELTTVAPGEDAGGRP